MSTQQLTTEAMALPLAERIALAQALWESIDSADLSDDQALADAVRRDGELCSGAVSGRRHDAVMEAARGAIA